KAVIEQLGEFFVYVSDGSKVSQRRVKLGKQIGTEIIVTDGLKEGEVVAVEGVQSLREGAAISVVSAGATK
ncbi:MAG: efflux transporter periplasmic adaptor subunit, partial [Imperialibacter sp.]